MTGKTAAHTKKAEVQKTSEKKLAQKNRLRHASAGAVSTQSFDAKLGLESYRTVVSAAPGKPRRNWASRHTLHATAKNDKKMEKKEKEKKKRGRQSAAADGTGGRPALMPVATGGHVACGLHRPTGNQGKGDNRRRRRSPERRHIWCKFFFFPRSK